MTTLLGAGMSGKPCHGTVPAGSICERRMAVLWPPASGDCHFGQPTLHMQVHHKHPILLAACCAHAVTRALPVLPTAGQNHEYTQSQSQGAGAAAAC